jgi:hypothetical protein
LNICGSGRINYRVRQFRNILFALTAFLWLPASVHCQIESLPGFEFLHCEVGSAAAHNPGQDCNDCCSVEKLQYCSGEIRIAIPLPDLISLPFMPATDPVVVPPAVSDIRLSTTIPPDLPHRWQFLSRTALPVRAPSSAS